MLSFNLPKAFEYHIFQIIHFLAHCGEYTHLRASALGFRVLYFTDHIALSVLRMIYPLAGIGLRLLNLVFFISHMVQLIADDLSISNRLPKAFRRYIFSDSIYLRLLKSSDLWRVIPQRSRLYLYMYYPLA